MNALGALVDEFDFGDGCPRKLARNLFRDAADFFNWETGQCNPSLRTLASKSDYTDLTYVRKGIRWLETLGVWTVDFVINRFGEVNLWIDWNHTVIERAVARRNSRKTAKFSPSEQKISSRHNNDEPGLEPEREPGKESARATSADLFEGGEGKAEAPTPEAPPKRRILQPSPWPDGYPIYEPEPRASATCWAEAKPADPQPASQPADTDPAPGAKGLREDEAQPRLRDDLTAWRPDQAGIVLAIANGAVDVEAEIAVFLAVHARRRTPFARLASCWPSWCERIPTYGPNGARRGVDLASSRQWTPADTAGPTIEGEAVAGDEQQPPDIVISSTAVTLAETAPADGDQPMPASDGELDGLINRIARHWAHDLRKEADPAAWLAELRRALAGYPAVVLHHAVDQACADLRFPPRVADFTTRAERIMTRARLHFLDLREAAGRAAQAEADAAGNQLRERTAAEARGRAETEASARREAEARTEGARIISRSGIEPSFHERIQPFAEILARVWPAGKSPAWGKGLWRAQACEAVAIAREDIPAARAFIQACEAANQEDRGDAPATPWADANRGADPEHLFAEIVRRLRGEAA